MKKSKIIKIYEGTLSALMDYQVLRYNFPLKFLFITDA